MVEIIKGLETLTKSLEFATLSKGLVALADEGSGGAVDAVPLEQLKGDIARAGHPVMRTIALDVDNRRLFFVDKAGNFLFAEYGTHDEGYQISRVGMQAEIAKEYDAVDLEKEPFNRVTTEHEEAEQDDTPGMVPSGTPGDRPDDEDGRGFGERIDKTLGVIASLLKAGPPRPGLVPQSGNPDKPGRWIKPSSASLDQIVSTRREAFSRLQQVERASKNHSNAGRWKESRETADEAKSLKAHIAELDAAANKKSTEKSMDSLNKVMND